MFETETGHTTSGFGIHKAEFWIGKRLITYKVSAAGTIEVELDIKRKYGLNFYRKGLIMKLLGRFNK